jgi:DNA-3-methyladenine glycosylase I
MVRVTRCGWAETDPLLREYHDSEWGVPLHGDRKLFEFLTLEGAQAGLNWLVILKKRNAYRSAFDRFNPKKIAAYSGSDIRRLLVNPDIIRNRLKITAAVTNARQFMLVQEEFGSFNDYIWQFVGHKPIKHRFRTLSSIPATSKESDRMSDDLRKRGFKFVGSTICYAFMQAVGMVNDHLSNCFRYNEV